MLNEENKERCRRIIDHYGHRPQLGMVIEECSELIQATAKVLRNCPCAVNQPYAIPENFKEELAGVAAMLEQARQMANISEAEINSRVEKKLEKVIARFGTKQEE